METMFTMIILLLGSCLVFLGFLLRHYKSLSEALLEGSGPVVIIGLLLFARHDLNPTAMKLSPATLVIISLTLLGLTAYNILVGNSVRRSGAKARLWVTRGIVVLGMAILTVIICTGCGRENARHAVTEPRLPAPAFQITPATPVDITTASGSVVVQKLEQMSGGGVRGTVVIDGSTYLVSHQVTLDSTGLYQSVSAEAADGSPVFGYSEEVTRDHWTISGTSPSQSLRVNIVVNLNNRTYRETLTKTVGNNPAESITIPSVTEGNPNAYEDFISPLQSELLSDRNKEFVQLTHSRAWIRVLDPQGITRAQWREGLRSVGSMCATLGAAVGMFSGGNPWLKGAAGAAIAAGGLCNAIAANDLRDELEEQARAGNSSGGGGSSGAS